MKERLSFTGTGEPFQKLQLQMLGAFAEFERSMIRERQREGIDAAKAVGRHCGRPSKLASAQLVAIRERKAQGEDMTALAAEHGVSRQTLYKALARED